MGVLSRFLQGTVVSLKRYVVSKGIFQSATTRAIEHQKICFEVDKENSFSVIAADCTFEYFLGSISNTCGWTQDGSDDFDWTRTSGGTPSHATGPSADHTYGTSQGKQSDMEMQVQHLLRWNFSTLSKQEQQWPAWAFATNNFIL